MKETDAEKIAALEKENKKLLKQINNLSKSAEQLPAYQLYIEARSMLITWLGISIGILAILGISSIHEAKEQVVEYSKNTIKEELDAENSSLNNQLLKELDLNLLREELMIDLAEDIKEDIIPKIAALEVEIDRQLKDSPEVQNNQYAVVVASSSAKTDVQNEKELVRRRLGETSDLYEMKICPPKPGQSNRHFLILDSPKTSEEAISLVSKVKKEQVFSDAAGAYPIRLDSALFEYSEECT